MKIYVIAVMLATLAPNMEELLDECVAEQHDSSAVWARDPDALQDLWECAYARYLVHRGYKRHN